MGMGIGRRALVVVFWDTWLRRNMRGKSTQHGRGQGAMSRMYPGKIPQIKVHARLAPARA
jgi:hypothetical protein